MSGINDSHDTVPAGSLTQAIETDGGYKILLRTEEPCARLETGSCTMDSDFKLAATMKLSESGDYNIIYETTDECLRDGCQVIFANKLDALKYERQAEGSVEEKSPSNQ